MSRQDPFLQPQTPPVRPDTDPLQEQIPPQQPARFAESEEAASAPLEPDVVTEASMESFPASDAPAWTHLRL